MNWTDGTLLLLFAVIPALLVLATAALLLQQQLRRARQEVAAALRERAFNSVMPLRIAAYERAMLFCTRMQPDALLLRAEPGNRSAQVMRAFLVEELRAEFEHNAVQQLYVSEAAWSALVAGRDRLIAAVNDAGNEIGDSATGVALSQAVLRRLNEGGGNPMEPAMRALRADMQRMLA